MRRRRRDGLVRHRRAIRALCLRRRNIFPAARANPVEHSFSTVYEPSIAEPKACIKTVLVALAFHYRELRPPGNSPARVALLPGAWNPPTVAHLALARAALNWAHEVILTLPRTMPHKEFEGTGLRDRLRLLGMVAVSERNLSVATAEGGLYVEMADEAARCLGPETEIGLVCGRDAAERIANWDYGRPGVFEDMLHRYPLLVAARQGEYAIAPRHSERIVRLPLPADFSEVSSSEIRRRMAAGEEWESLVPAGIAPIVRKLYAGLLM